MVISKDLWHYTCYWVFGIGTDSTCIHLSTKPSEWGTYYALSHSNMIVMHYHLIEAYLSELLILLHKITLTNLIKESKSFINS